MVRAPFAAAAATAAQVKRVAPLAATPSTTSCSPTPCAAIAARGGGLVVLGILDCTSKGGSAAGHDQQQASRGQSKVGGNSAPSCAAMRPEVAGNRRRPGGHRCAGFFAAARARRQWPEGRGAPRRPRQAAISTRPAMPTRPAMRPARESRVDCFGGGEIGLCGHGRSCLAQTVNRARPCRASGDAAGWAMGGVAGQNRSIRRSLAKDCLRRAEKPLLARRVFAIRCARWASRAIPAGKDAKERTRNRMSKAFIAQVIQESAQLTGTAATARPATWSPRS